MRRVIALVIIGLGLCIAIIFLAKRGTSMQAEKPAPENYFQQLCECGPVCVPLSAVLVVIAE